MKILFLLALVAFSYGQVQASANICKDRHADAIFYHYSIEIDKQYPLTHSSDRPSIRHPYFWEEDTYIGSDQLMMKTAFKVFHEVLRDYFVVSCVGIAKCSERDVEYTELMCSSRHFPTLIQHCDSNILNDPKCGP